MILIFDLDDTLYDEKLYAISGFRAVAKYISMTYGVSINESVCILNQSLVSGTRERAFQDLIVAKSLPRREVNQCIRIYRNHKPDIYLDEVTKETLAELTKFQKYLVTDGNKLVQRKKIKALKLDSFFKRTFTTHSFGLSAAKPSTYCFKLIKDLEEASWSDLVYIGDDPSKDFVNLIKKREYFRPFAASVLQDDVHDWFDLRGMEDSPSMMYAVNCQPGVKEKIPAVIHVDGTCRIQTVTEEQNFHWYNLIKEFKNQTGVPALFNTSFNLGGEPLVETIDDAMRTLYNSGINYIYFPAVKMMVEIEHNDRA
jgi:FMN phosphatase YigB (HAD superfamily)